jgi:hypothetical protein
MKYNIWNAAAYEVCLLLIEHNSKWEQNFIIKKILSHCIWDWVEWKVERSMKEVDHQVKQIKFEMDSYYDQQNQPIVTEYESDGSQAQQLLGGAIEIKSAWSNHERPEF